MSVEPGINGHETSDKVTYLNQTPLTRPIQLNANMPLYLPYEKVKPCVCLKFSIQDSSPLMFMINYVQNCLTDLVSKINKQKNFSIFVSITTIKMLLFKSK